MFYWLCTVSPVFVIAIEPGHDTDPKLRKSLTRYRLSEHSLAIEKGRHRQTWLSREDRLCFHCTHNQVEIELLFLTSTSGIHTSHGLQSNARTSKTLQILTTCHTCLEKYNNVRTQQQDSSPVVMREGPQTPHRLTLHTVIALLHV